jgi:hypothetical protein
MQAFLRRLKYFLTGFIPGTILVILFFQNRGCSWLPGNRVKGEILERIIVVNKEIDFKNKTKIPHQENLKKFIEGSKIDFDLSKTHSDPQIYVLENNGKKMVFVLPKESFISEIVSNTSNHLSNSGTGEMIYFPTVENWTYTDTNRLLTCKQSETGLLNDERIFSLLKKNGVFSFDKSKLLTSDKVHYMYIKSDKNELIGLKSIFYKDKIDVVDFDLPYKTNCSN